MAHTKSNKKFKLIRNPAIFQVEAIKGHRFDKMTGKLMYSIKWKNYSDKDNTWEECDSLNCPDLLERYNFKVCC